jgi:hypothetical protein
MVSSIVATIRRDQLTSSLNETFRNHTCSCEASRIMREPLRWNTDHGLGRVSLVTARTEAPIDASRMTSLGITSFFIY